MRANGKFRVLAPSGRLAVSELASRGGFRNAYDATTRWSPNRTFIQSSNRDAKVDISTGTRKSIMAQSRWLFQNMPVYTGIVEALVTYVVGTGIIPAAVSSDAEWNKAAQNEFKVWSARPELRTRLSWGGYQKICVRGVLVDGEFFTQLTQGPSGLPRLAMIESHRVTDPESRKLDPAKTAERQEPDGIETDANGRVVRWLVPYRARNGAQSVRKVKESSMIQSWLPIRPEQYRGITMFASAVNTSRDLEDILSYEKSSVKRLSSRTDVVETQSGELDPESVLRDLESVSWHSCPDEATKYYKDVIGSETVVMRTGDKYAPIESDRPSAAWQGFVDFLVQSICQVTGIPFNVLVPAKVGGADTRRDLARAARVFESWQAELTTGWQRAYEYVVADAVRKGRIPQGPADWWKTEWQYPKTVTVDYGREAKEDRADVKSGLITLEEYWARYGLDWRDQVAQLKSEADEVKATDEDLYGRIYEDSKAVPGQPEPPEKKDKNNAVKP